MSTIVTGQFDMNKPTYYGEAYAFCGNCEYFTESGYCCNENSKDYMKAVNKNSNCDEFEEL